MARVTVHLWSGLRRLAADQEALTVEATTVGTMLDAICAAHPGLSPLIKSGVSIALNSEIINGGRHRPIAPEDEIHLLQRIKGG